MIPDGELDIEMVNGRFRWTYVTVGGATHLGPLLYKTRAAAKGAGRKWLTEQTEQRP